MKFEVTQRIDERSVAHLAISGCLDTTTCHLLTAAIHDAMSGDRIHGLIVNLNEVSFLDIDGVRTIEQAHRLVTRASVPFVVVNTHNHTARSILDHSGVLTATSKA